ncbi:hypothetical protein [uncultured Tenacibaculum sp.]|uniref:hypothetical protein n=1 Tax=uncultured Tenacibaculum sp. TaxID=174713 RepID=UPI00260E5D50|nr:hypothetical protein [uncultured Tenacibaculum sp.]
MKNWNFQKKHTKVYLLDSSNQDHTKTEIVGSFVTQTNSIIFIPRFPFLQGKTYIIKTNDDQQEFLVPKSVRSKPVVTAVYPTKNKIPENILRMYIQFSNPMKTTGNLKNIKLYNSTGIEVKGVIFNNVYELWNEAQTQLTIIFDPSRVKTGLKINENLGRALESGENYKIVVSNLEDIYGQRLKNSYTKHFYVTEEDTQSPNHEKWTLKSPKANTTESLNIDFKESIDMMSLQNRLFVFSSGNDRIDGKIKFNNNEKSWKFIPNQKWTKGDYILKINSRLSDPSGNNLNGLFDHKIGSLKYHQEGKIQKLKFNIK